jgi:U3 small nucleolar RNA-associated protein 10
LLSHVTAIPLPSAQLALLKAIEEVSDKVKAQLLLPVMQGLVNDSPPRTELARGFGSRLEEFASLVVSSFDASASGGLNEQDSPSWPMFVLALRHYFQTGTQDLVTLAAILRIVI